MPGKLNEIAVIVTPHDACTLYQAMETRRKQVEKECKEINAFLDPDNPMPMRCGLPVELANLPIEDISANLQPWYSMLHTITYWRDKFDEIRRMPLVVPLDANEAKER